MAQTLSTDMAVLVAVVGMAVLAHIHGFLNETQLHETILELRETEKRLCAGLQ